MILQSDWLKRLAYHCNISTVANTNRSGFSPQQSPVKQALMFYSMHRQVTSALAAAFLCHTMHSHTDYLTPPMALRHLQGMPLWCLWLQVIPQTPEWPALEWHTSGWAPNQRCCSHHYCHCSHIPVLEEVGQCHVHVVWNCGVAQREACSEQLFPAQSPDWDSCNRQL